MLKNVEQVHGLNYTGPESLLTVLLLPTQDRKVMVAQRLSTSDKPVNTGAGI